MLPWFRRALGLTPRASAPADRPIEASAVVTFAATSANAFAFDLLAKLDASENLALSPASIALGLVMTWSGARGDTAASMRAVLHLADDDSEVLTQWADLTRALQDPARPFVLRIANRLFVDAGYTLEPGFVEQTAARFGAPLEGVDFRAAPEAARATVNAWVEDRTQRRIRDLLPSGCITSLTRLALVNALYFLADWADPFEKSATHSARFHVSPATTKTVPTMHRTASYRVARGDGAMVLEIPCIGHDVAILVVLPDRRDGLADAERAISGARLAAWRAALAPQHVALALPRFEVDLATPLALREPLASLGMGVAFDPAKADFTGIAAPRDPGDELCIADVFHKAFVRVDEKGTEAAAATAVVMMMRGMPDAAPQALPFRVDHPFLFVIVEQSTGLALFVGRVVDPSAR